MKPIIEVQNLSKKYRITHKKGGFAYNTLRDDLVHIFKKPFNWAYSKKETKEDIWALRDVSFKVQEGEILGIIGLNGAGKSTLLKILTRITPPTQGQVIIRGRVGSLLEIGTGFHPELTGRENIYLNGTILGMKKKEIDRKFNEIVDFSGVEKFLDTPVKRFSSGMYVRLAFSVAAHLEPEILLIDEVLAVGDAVFQKKSLSKMEEASQKGRTVFFVSHNMATIMNLCKRTILLDSGKLVADGQTPEVVRQYMGIKKNKSCEVSWNDINSAPGNDQVRLKSVRILSDNGLPILEADIDKDILIEMSYFNLKEGAKLLSSIHLVSNYGVTVLSSFNAPSASLTFDPWYEKPRPKGLYRTVCRIPANFLNDGSYFVNVYIATYEGARIAQVAQDRVISFDVIDTGQMRKEFSGTWVGAVRPRLAWKTELLSEF